MELSKAQKHTLLNIAEWSIQDYLLVGNRRPIPDKFCLDKTLKSRVGAFVTVYVENKLRGCIGTFSETEPLYENINRMALQAAFQDNRFKAVRKSELNKMKVEISVLSPRKRISGPEDIVIGKHGIYLIHGIRRATLLPQVAVTNHWNAIEFLECCAENKLGLYRDSWKEAELYVYEALVIS